MTKSSFIDEDWTGLNKEQIQERIIAELNPGVRKDIQTERRQVSIFLLTVLQAILNEQQKARTLDKKTADYIYSAVKDQAIRQGWLE